MQCTKKLRQDWDIEGLDYDSPWPHTSTGDSLPLCKVWLQECYKSHNGCAPSGARDLPTRLIYIAEITPRLCLSGELDKSIRYATLSHCWGLVKFPDLTTGSFGAFCQSIPSQALSKTFRDAIYIARYLGFSYLWIDSLCIFQDSEEDWARESSSMAKVYGGADLNIAASSARDGRDGCFFNRPSNWRCQVRVHTTEGEVLYDAVADQSLSPRSMTEAG